MGAHCGDEGDLVFKDPPPLVHHFSPCQSSLCFSTPSKQLLPPTPSLYMTAVGGGVIVSMAASLRLPIFS